MFVPIVGIVGSFLAEVAGGIVAYQLTEGRRSTARYEIPTQHITIEHHFSFYDSRQDSDENLIWNILFALLFLVMVIVCIVGILAVLMIHFSFYVVLSLLVSGFLIVLLSFIGGLLSIQNEEYPIRPQILMEPLYLILLGASFLGTAWIIDNPINLPVGWEVVRKEAEAIVIGSTNWVNSSFSLALDHFQVALYYAFQTLGVLILIFPLTITIYLLLVYLHNIFSDSEDDIHVPAFLFHSITVLSIIATIFLGLGWPFFDYIFFNPK